MSDRRTVVLRADAGPEVGLGHLQRSLGLAVALGENGCSSIVRAPEAGDICARVESLGLRYEAAGANWSASEEAAALDRLRAAAVVIDSYPALEEDLSGLRRADRPLVVVDDLARFALSCDVVVNGALGASDLPYYRLAPAAKTLLGIEYLLLHPDLWDVTPHAPSESVETVLVTCGGSAGSIGPLQRLLSMIDTAFEDFQLIVAAPEGVAARLGASRSSSGEVTVVSPRTTVREAAESADLAVASAGGTTRELLRLGVPTLAVLTADNQRRGAVELSRLEAIKLFESIDDAEAGLTRAIDELVDSYEERRRLAERGPQLIDGQGCRRAAATISNLLA